MAFKPGYKAYFGLDNSAGALQNLSAYASDFEFPFPIDQIEVSTFRAAGTADKNFIPGLTGGGQVTYNGPLDTTLYNHMGSLVAAQNAGTTGFTVEFAPMGSATTLPKISCEAYVAEFSPKSSVSGLAEYSVSLQLTGVVTFGVY